MAKRTYDPKRTEERLAAQVVRCRCGAKPGERCRTTQASIRPGTPTTTHTSRVTGWRKLKLWEGRER